MSTRKTPVVHFFNIGVLGSLVSCRSKLWIILTELRCFEWYLHNIAWREPTSACHACGTIQDTAEYSHSKFIAWVVTHRALAAVVVTDLSLLSVVQALVGSKSTWQTMKICDNDWTLGYHILESASACRATKRLIKHYDSFLCLDVFLVPRQPLSSKIILYILSVSV